MTLTNGVSLQPLHVPTLKIQEAMGRAKAKSRQVQNVQNGPKPLKSRVTGPNHHLVLLSFIEYPPGN